MLAQNTQDLDFKIPKFLLHGSSRSLLARESFERSKQIFVLNGCLQFYYSGHSLIWLRQLLNFLVSVDFVKEVHNISWMRVQLEGFWPSLKVKRGS